MMRIGYQGDVGSNAEQAAKELTAHLGQEGLEFIPLISSDRVMASLNEGSVDMGVFAITNNIGGTVEETSDALKDADLRPEGACTLDIHHCLFTLPGTEADEIAAVASHPQALIQCSGYLESEFPDAVLMQVSDTAVSAKMLSAGELGRDVAVLCRMNAGLMHGLRLQEKDVEDSESRTEFRMYSSK